VNSSGSKRNSGTYRRTEKTDRFSSVRNCIHKKIKGKVYYYHRVSIDGKRKEIYVPQDKAEELISKINTRKELEKELRQHRAINAHCHKKGDMP
jgi:hypothetical protein